MTRPRPTDDREFGDWLAARWPVLVRTLLLLGLPPRDARGVGFATVVSVRPEFTRLLVEEDLDAAVHRELHDRLGRHRRRRDAPEPADPAPDPEAGPDAAERLAEVVSVLTALTPAQREVAVHRQDSGLADDQVADVLDREPEPVPKLPDPDVRLALTALPVAPLPVAEVDEAVRADRARAVRRGVGVVLAVVLVVVGAGWWLRPGADGTGEVTRATNPLPIAWYADGVLHLAEVTVTVRPVVDLVTVPGGVVMADDRGDVVLVEEDGTLVPLGATVPGQGLVAERDNGWVAWADPGAGLPEVVVMDTRLGEEVGRRSLSRPGEGGGQPVAGSGPVAVDDERVYYAARGNDYVWEPLAGSAFAVSGTLVDTAAGARVSEVPGGFLVQGSPYQSGARVPGRRARLTPDGRFVFVVDERDDLAVLDTGTGLPVGPLYSPSDRAVSWSYDEGVFWFAVEHRLQNKTYQDMLQMPSRGDYRIFECVPGRSDVCIQRAEVREDAPEPPVLAH